MVDRLTEFENRLTAMENSHTKLAGEFRAFCDDTFTPFKDEISEKLDTITDFVSGANTIFGFARKHWKRIVYFGAGVMTSAGFGNPKVWAFISSFTGN